MKRINIFAKGNVDVHDSLIYSRVNGRIQWNGINTLLAERHPHHVARVRHESCAHWDLAGLDGPAIPEELAARNLPLGTFTLESQFRSRLIDLAGEVVVLSIQPVVMNPLFRHRRAGYPFFPADSPAWTEPDRRWAADTFQRGGLVSPATAMGRLASLVATIRARSHPSILVFNMSPVMPGERMVSQRGLEDALSTRVRAFNLALLEAAPALDLSIVDVEQVTARAGADGLKLDPIHYTPAGYRLIAAEVVRIMEDRGHFDG